MPELKIVPGDLVRTLELNGYDLAEFVKVYEAAMTDVYIPVTEGAKDTDIAEIKTGKVQTRGGFRYSKNRTTRRLKGGGLSKSAVATIALAVGVTALVWAASSYMDASSLISAGKEAVSGVCSSTAIKEAGTVAYKKVMNEAYLPIIGPIQQWSPAFEAYKATTAQQKLVCAAIATAAKTAASSLVSTIPAVGVGGVLSCGYGILKFSDPTEAINKTLAVPSALPTPAFTPTEPKQLAPIYTPRKGGASTHGEKILLFDTDDTDNIKEMMRARTILEASEKLKATTARQFLSLLGATEPVNKIIGKNLQSDNTNQKGGGATGVSYIEVRKSLLMLGILPGVIDEILSRVDVPSLSEPAKANIKNSK